MNKVMQAHVFSRTMDECDKWRSVWYGLCVIWAVLEVCSLITLIHRAIYTIIPLQLFKSYCAECDKFYKNNNCLFQKYLEELLVPFKHLLQTDLSISFILQKASKLWIVSDNSKFKMLDNSLPPAWVMVASMLKDGWHNNQEGFKYSYIVRGCRFLKKSYCDWPDIADDKRNWHTGDKIFWRVSVVLKAWCTEMQNLEKPQLLTRQ